MFNPLVSIIIPVYNGSDYLAEAIDSALTQTYKNIEIIVVNDGSSDNGATERIAQSYGNKIRYFTKENGGVSSALNMGIDKMNGNYFSWLSHDDLYLPEKIEKQLIAYEKDNSHCIVSCQTSFIDKNGNPLKRKSRKILAGRYSSTETLEKIFTGYSISGCALLIPKMYFDKVGKFNTLLKYMQDTEMWYRILLSGADFLLTNDLGVLSRIHPSQTTVTAKSLGYSDAVIVGEFMVHELKKIPSANSNLLKRYLYICYRNRSFLAGNSAFKILVAQKQLSLGDYIIIPLFKMYGIVRPLLIRVYYKYFYKIRVNK